MFIKSLIITFSVQIVIAVVVGLIIKFYYGIIRKCLIRYMIMKNVDVKKLPNYKLMNMCLMVFDGDVDGIKLLLHSKADPDTEYTLEGGNAIYIAAQQNEVEILKLLLDAKGSTELGNRRHGSTPLTIASNYNSIDSVKLLLEAKADPDKYHTFCGETPLFIAVARHNYCVFKLLLKHKANVEMGNLKNGQTSLFLSVYNNRFLMANQLINAGAKMDKVDGNTGMTPLSCAIYNGNIGLVRTLVKAGANINMKDANGIMPYTLAEIMDRKECIEYIKEFKEQKEKEAQDKALGENCPICIEPMGDITEMHITNCYHVFHRDCWTSYETTGNVICPICRSI